MLPPLPSGLRIQPPSDAAGTASPSAQASAQSEAAQPRKVPESTGARDHSTLRDIEAALERVEALAAELAQIADAGCVDLAHDLAAMDESELVHEQEEDEQGADHEDGGEDEDDGEDKNEQRAEDPEESASSHSDEAEGDLSTDMALVPWYAHGASDRSTRYLSLAGIGERGRSRKRQRHWAHQDSPPKRRTRKKRKSDLRRRLLTLALLKEIIAILEHKIAILQSQLIALRVLSSGGDREAPPDQAGRPG